MQILAVLPNKRTDGCVWWISCLRSNNANRQRPKPARIVPFVVIRIGSGTDCSFSRAASLNSSITPVQPSSSSARCSRSCSGEQRTGRPSNRLIAVGLKDCGGRGTAEISSTAIELRRSWKSSDSLAVHRACKVEPRIGAWNSCASDDKRGSPSALARGVTEPNPRSLASRPVCPSGGLC